MIESFEITGLTSYDFFTIIWVLSRGGEGIRAVRFLRKSCYLDFQECYDIYKKLSDSTDSKDNEYAIYKKILEDSAK